MPQNDGGPEQLGAAPRRPSDTLLREWRFVRLQILEHIRAARTWADIKEGADALFYVSVIVRPMLEEQYASESAAMMRATGEQ